jgi:hypothetical protein
MSKFRASLIFRTDAGLDVEAFRLAAWAQMGPGWAEKLRAATGAGDLTVTLESVAEVETALETAARHAAEDPTVRKTLLTRGPARPAVGLVSTIPLPRWSGYEVALIRGAGTGIEREKRFDLADAEAARAYHDELVAEFDGANSHEGFICRRDQKRRAADGSLAFKRAPPVDSEGRTVKPRDWDPEAAAEMEHDDREDGR